MKAADQLTFKRDQVGPIITPSGRRGRRCRETLLALTVEEEATDQEGKAAARSPHPPSTPHPGLTPDGR